MFDSTLVLGVWMETSELPASANVLDLIALPMALCLPQLQPKGSGEKPG